MWLCAPVAEIAEGTRQKCDVCETSILNRHWACTHPGCEWEVCIHCHRAGERRRAARRERYERLQRGETYSSMSALAQPSARAQKALGAANRSGALALNRPPADVPTWLQKRNDYVGDLTSLQVKIDAVFPAIPNRKGELWREFEASLPKDGKYAGQPCAQCNVPFCSMRHSLFHHKNLATHGRPRSSGIKVTVFSCTHEAAFQAFVAVYSQGDLSVAEVRAHHAHAFRGRLRHPRHPCHSRQPRPRPRPRPWSRHPSFLRCVAPWAVAPLARLRPRRRSKRRVPRSRSSAIRRLPRRRAVLALARRR